MRKTLQTLVITTFVSVILIVNMSIVIGMPFVNVFRQALISQKKTFNLILKNEKKADDIVYIQKSIATTQKQVARLAIFTRKLSTILPISTVVPITDSIAAASLQLPQFLGDGKETNFVLLFLNNYELRPGGGFIGSLGFVTLKNYSIVKFEIQDVYEIDGQITAHYEPHYAVRKYLNQPNEFLRDSNFSPDFRINAQKAVQHLSYIPAYNKPYVAVIGITTSAFEDLLRLTGPIELTDYNTTVTSSNFFTTTQRKIENEFFAGSRHKRSILQSLGNEMRQRVDELPLLDIIEYIFTSVKTKNLVFFSPNGKMQNLFTILDAAGSHTSSYKDRIMPVDANVGVNKMDALVYKTMELQLSPGGDALTHTFKSTYTNTITADALEKESYKNYFQLYVPVEATIKKTLLNGVDVSRQIVTTVESGNTVFALYFKTRPASSTTVTLTYNLPYSSVLKQIHFQKQIGAKSSPVTVIYKGLNLKIKQILLQSDEVFSFL